MRSSNCFNGESWTTDSVITRQLLICESDQSSNPIKVAWASCWTVSTLRRSVLGRSQRGLFRFLRSLIFCQQCLYLAGRRVVIQRLLQGVPVRVRLLVEHIIATAARTATAAATAAVAAAAEHPAHAAAGAHRRARIHHFLDERLDGAPVGVIGKIQLLADSCPSSSAAFGPDRNCGRRGRHHRRQIRPPPPPPPPPPNPPPPPPPGCA